MTTLNASGGASLVGGRLDVLELDVLEDVQHVGTKLEERPGQEPLKQL
jgi:hypothetical protein